MVLGVVAVLILLAGLFLWQWPRRSRTESAGTPALVPATPEKLPGGLVLYFNFDSEPTAGKVPDLSGHGNDGQAVNVQWVADSHRGGCVRFGLTNSYIRVPDNDSLNPTDMTLAAWINTSLTDRTWRRIFDKAYGKEFDLTMGGDNAVGGTNDGKSWRGQVALEVAHQWAPSGFKVADGQWHQVVGTFDGSALQLYIDGRPIGKPRRAKGHPGHAAFDLTIGQNSSIGSPEEIGQSFDGMMDDVMMFNRALSPDEVAALYNSQKNASDAAIEPEAPVGSGARTGTGKPAFQYPVSWNQPSGSNSNALAENLDRRENGGRLFPKMPPATNVYVVNCLKDSITAKGTAFALQGLVNQRSAEVYVIANGEGRRSLKRAGALSNRPIEILTQLQGENAGLRILFQKYQEHVKKMFLYDPKKDWTWYLAQMASAQNDGIPVTKSLEEDLTAEFGWKGEVEDFRNGWANPIDAYNWALTNLMPGCSKQVVFQSVMGKPLGDYVAASRGFNFWLNPDNPEGHAETEKIYSTKGYGLGTSLMGYHFDRANVIANPYGIGYVVSDNYANGSFWASFPDKTYTQPPGKAVKAEPGKIYASIAWSDGDNLSFDQDALFDYWQDDPARGTIPVAVKLNPNLQELNSPLLDWYYSNMTTNDELMCGPSGVQFIFIDNFNDRLFPAWCQLTREWCENAGFHCSRLWNCTTRAKLDTYLKTCGFDGVFGCGKSNRPGCPPQLDTITARDEEDLFKQFIKVKPNPQRPVFVDFEPITLGFYKGDGGYTKIKRQIERVEAAHPGRYVFLLPKDQMATVRTYRETH